MFHPEVAILTRKDTAAGRPGFLKYIFSLPATRYTDSLTDGLLKAEVRSAGFLPTVHELSKPIQWADSKAEVAFISINDPLSLASIVRDREHLKKFRTIIFGGQLASLNPQLIQRLFPESIVFCGEVEGSGSELLEDAMGGTKGRIYRAAPVDIRSSYLLPERDNGHYLIRASELGRGCKYSCSFCALPKEFHPVRMRDVDEFLAEIDRLGKRVLLVDPNLSVYPREALLRVFEHFARRKIMWSGSGSEKELITDPELWDLMSRTCFGMLTGIEDFDLRLGKANSALLPEINGSILIRSFIVGQQQQTEEGLLATLRRVRSQNLTATFHLYSPYPGTRDFEDATMNGKLLTNDLALFDRRHPVIRGEHLSPEDVVRLYIKLNKQAHGLLGSLKDAWRVLKDSKWFSEGVARICFLFVFRVMPRIIALSPWIKKAGDGESLIPIESEDSAGQASSASSS